MIILGFEKFFVIHFYTTSFSVVGLKWNTQECPNESRQTIAKFLKSVDVTLWMTDYRHKNGEITKTV